MNADKPAEQPSDPASLEVGAMSFVFVSHAAADKRSWAHMKTFFNEIFAVKK